MKIVNVLRILQFCAALVGVVVTADKLQDHLNEKYAKAKEYLQSGVCTHVFIDIGSNRGIQIRKLYEPQDYPKAPILEKFSQYFGATRENVCVFAFEPNPVHAEWLDELQRIYNARNLPVVIFTTTAMSSSDGTADFYRDTRKREEVGASLVDWQHGHGNAVTVSLVDMAKFINELLVNRPGQQKHSKILAKMDIEGAEYDVVSHLLVTGTLCKLDEAMIEWHPDKMAGASKSFPSFLAFVVKNAHNCETVLSTFDDETYARDHRPLPGTRDYASNAGALNTVAAKGSSAPPSDSSSGLMLMAAVGVIALVLAVFKWKKRPVANESRSFA